MKFQELRDQLAAVGDIVRITYGAEETFASGNYGTVTAKLYTVQRRRTRGPAGESLESGAVGGQRE
jgi:hypothetical protein